MSIKTGKSKKIVLRIYYWNLAKIWWIVSWAKRFIRNLVIEFRGYLEIITKWTEHYKVTLELKHR